MSVSLVNQVGMMMMKEQTQKENPRFLFQLKMHAAPTHKALSARSNPTSQTPPNQDIVV